MPKVNNPSIPLSGIFAVAKPSGMTSMAVVETIQKLFSDSPLFMEAEALEKQRSKTGKKKIKLQRKIGPVKVGQGGTLDPLADGVLVVGVSKGTKSLGRFLHCTKEYKTIGLLGCETDSYDSEGARVRTASWKHITREQVEATLAGFRGPIKQVPPIYSALKMDGKPLYEYAREGKPLPRPIEARDANVLELELINWQEARSTSNPPGHTYAWPTKELSEADKSRYAGVKDLIAKAESKRPPGDGKPLTAQLLDQPDSGEPSTSGQTAPTVDSWDAIPEPERPPTFELKMTVSSGTYVRSIVHDIGLALGSAAHVVSLTRTRQGEFGLDDGESDQGDCVPWNVLEKASQDQKDGLPGSPLGAITDDTKRAEWEQIVFSKWHD
ncbi:hypothetical protein M407DRAFT_24482 [Tulasnella calospora MUT 4182]|uniref:tRNA pseudouridine(55) synthase n=1 Tax=Tulasnella calospora MUT 4182 TaxID=1051891 RepID=A0A0C3Q8S1_9AGAM|nr:hypothetical protein M407DRAFT_24482 [Tulasnella calospora MUT 4182]